MRSTEGVVIAKVFRRNQDHLGRAAFLGFQKRAQPFLTFLGVADELLRCTGERLLETTEHTALAQSFDARPRAEDREPEIGHEVCLVRDDLEAKFFFRRVFLRRVEHRKLAVFRFQARIARRRKAARHDVDRLRSFLGTGHRELVTGFFAGNPNLRVLPMEVLDENRIGAAGHLGIGSTGTGGDCGTDEACALRADETVGFLLTDVHHEDRILPARPQILQELGFHQKVDAAGANRLLECDHLGIEAQELPDFDVEAFLLVEALLVGEEQRNRAQLCRPRADHDGFNLLASRRSDLRRKYDAGENCQQSKQSVFHPTSLPLSICVPRPTWHGSAYTLE